ncbi:MAG: FecR domain-containing protein [Deltaproteobacteria bacterium]|nr:FecR domain-containing protein [Deltaproteobacteria bacterium]
MLKSVKSFFALLLVLQLVIPYSTFAAAIGQFSEVVGDVTQTRSGKTYRAVVQSPVEVNDLVVTGDKSSATMVFSDESIIKLEANSKLVIKDYSLTGKTRKSIFSLAIGKLTASVKKFIGGGNTFQVHSPTAVAGVRGTVFTVAAETISGVPTTTITCVEGSLTINALSAAGTVISTTTLVAGQTAVITATGITVTGAATAAGAAAAATEAGAVAGAGAAAGMTAGTIAVGTVITAVAIGATIISVSGEVTTTHHHTAP